MKKYVFAFYLASCASCFAGDSYQTKMDFIAKTQPIPFSGQRAAPSDVDKELHENRLSPPPFQLEKINYCRSLDYQEKTVLHYSKLPSPLFQEEIDAALILQRFYKSFLKTPHDLDKLSCLRFTRKILEIYQSEVTRYFQCEEIFKDISFEVLETSQVRNQNREKVERLLSDISFAQAPEELAKKIHQAIHEYLQTVIFTNQ